ncbi:MAG: hypothetical protein DRP64_09100, partial [Verrucomicrobia bacterium]
RPFNKENPEKNAFGGWFIARYGGRDRALPSHLERAGEPPAVRRNKLPISVFSSVAGGKNFLDPFGCFDAEEVEALAEGRGSFNLRL